jgi:hypothetical protein
LLTFEQQDILMVHQPKLPAENPYGKAIDAHPETASRSANYGPGAARR